MYMYTKKEHVENHDHIIMMDDMNSSPLMKQFFSTTSSPLTHHWKSKMDGPTLPVTIASNAIRIERP